MHSTCRLSEVHFTYMFRDALESHADLLSVVEREGKHKENEKGGLI